jgi:hypothetical protein
MCMNCGCGRPQDDHGNAANITAEDLQHAAEANGQSLRQSAQHILETVELLDAGRRDDGDRRHDGDRGLAEPAGPGGADAVGRDAGRGTPASES